MPRKPNKNKDHYNDPFPTHLRELIDERDLKQEDLKGVLGVEARQSVTGYIDGSTAPTAEKIAAIAELFHVSADWLLGLTEVRSPDMDVQAVCRFTGLSEDAINLLRLVPPASKQLNLLATPGNNALDSYLFRFLSALHGVEREAVIAAAFVLSDDSQKETVEASMKKDALELAVFHFSEVCRQIPEIFMSRGILSLIDEQYKELYLQDYQRFLAKEKQEASNGEHTEN